MKRVINYLLGAVVLLAATSLQSCDLDDWAMNYPNALVTIKTSATDGRVYFQLDDSTTILPTNMKSSPYGTKEVRALTNFKVDGGQSGHYSKTATVNWVDTILTKQMAPSVADNATTYGNNPIEIVRDWTTVVEDGYITLRFRTYFGNGKKHVINLVRGSNPYEVVLYHNANGDMYGVVRDGLVAFRLSDLPDTQGRTVNLTLKWLSFSGEKSTTFKYRTRP